MIWQVADRSDDEICRGRNGVVRLAIQILSVITNSAGVERAFSDFGNTHTKKRNRLSPERVHKTALVKMTTQRQHAAAGRLVNTRQKRNTGTNSSCADPFMSSSNITAAAVPTFDNAANASGPSIESFGDEPESNPSDISFQHFAQELIDDADQADKSDADHDGGEYGAEEHEKHLRVPSSGASSTTIVIPAQPRRTPARVSILLRDLFNYPRFGEEAGTGFAFYWHGGVKNYEEELRFFELVTISSASS